MIDNIPTAQDFSDTGKMFLNLAWDIVSDLYFNLEESKVEEWDDNHESETQFWISSHTLLSNALVLVQQGGEFLLKSRIVEVSPYLLLAQSPRDWPSGCDKKTFSFSSFRTVDAQDLKRIHDTVCVHRLNPKFSNQIEEIRRYRNSIMHTVNPNMVINPIDIWKWILEISENLITPKTWLKTRGHYLENRPISHVGGIDFASAYLVWEALELIKMLAPNELAKYFGVNPTKRWYNCPDCLRTYQEQINPDVEIVKTCQLMPAVPGSTNIYCFVCDNNHTVKREKCQQTGCQGDVIDNESGLCLTCGQ